MSDQTGASSEELALIAQLVGEGLPINLAAAEAHKRFLASTAAVPSPEDSELQID